MRIHTHSSIHLHIHSTHTTHFRQPVKVKKKSYYQYISPQSTKQSKIRKRKQKNKKTDNAGMSLMLDAGHDTSSLQV